MKMRKNKGKIHPSPSQSPSPSPSPPISPPYHNALSILTLLPAAILALISVLSVEDREVFAYMVRVNNPSSSIAADQEKNKKSSRKLLLGRGSVVVHKPPVFDCECFDCYTSYWFRWDSSPNRELIDKAIEEFEKHLFSQEQVKRSNKCKKREKIGRLGKDKAVEEERERGFEESFDLGLPESEVLDVASVLENEVFDAAAAEAVVVVEGSEAAASGENRGFVRKVFPDVVAILNSRLWGLWSPNA